MISFYFLLAIVALKASVVSELDDVELSLQQPWRKSILPIDAMKLEVTEKLLELLKTATESSTLSSALKHEAFVYVDAPEVPFSVIKSLCVALRGEDSEGPWVHQVCKGSRIMLSPPPKRQRSSELVKRLEQLQRQEDERVYRAMVGNVAKRDYEDHSFKLLPSLRLQLSFGAHVLLTMVVFFLLGSYATRVFSDKPAFQALGGVVGLAVALVLETTLFMVRSIALEKPKTS